MPGGGQSLVWAARSRAVDQSSGRNKRDDRLAEGHERVAGTVKVLRVVTPCALSWAMSLGPRGLVVHLSRL